MYCKMAWPRSRGEELNKRPHHINSGIFMFTKMMIIETRWGLTQQHHWFCSDTFLELHLFEEALTVKQETVVKSLKKCGVGYTLDDNDDVLFEGTESSNLNRSNDECDSKWWCYGILWPVETFYCSTILLNKHLWIWTSSVNEIFFSQFCLLKSWCVVGLEVFD